MSIVIYTDTVAINHQQLQFSRDDLVMKTITLSEVYTLNVRSLHISKPYVVLCVFYVCVSCLAG